MIVLPSSLITEIKEVLHQAQYINNRRKRHEMVQNELIFLLRRHGFEPFKEFHVICRTKYRNNARFGELKSRKGGMLDIYASYIDIRLAIEYDNSASLKWKSIEKLLQSDANYCFGLIYGTKDDNSYANYYEKNLRKIQQVYTELIKHYDSHKEFENLHTLLKKDFWLGIGKFNVLEQVALKEIMRLTPTYK